MEFHSCLRHKTARNSLRRSSI